ncbi:hypothetical protein CEV32_4771 [Brucella rhizosphaerae]|uniref:Uncharacterized protein n=1 Tax=Brucella rhizosphaerae TaxID=571254 RepID=A0A256FLA6_9HYPH|nr:hypothetical protein CEV32_4771 [Brucella rhizosphaerae]
MVLVGGQWVSWMAIIMASKTSEPISQTGADVAIVGKRG